MRASANQAGSEPTGTPRAFCASTYDSCAAIGYLKEAEAGVKSEDATLGIIRHHLAQAYEASGDKENAKTTLDRAIAAHEAYVEAQKARGVPVGADPAWFADARKMRDRL